MHAVRERAAISFTARAHADGKLQQHLLTEFSAGQLDHERLLRFLRDGESRAWRSAWAACAARAEPCPSLLYHADRRHLAALCLAAGLATPHYLTLRMALEIAEEAMAPRRATRATAPRRSASCRRSTRSCAATRPSCGSCGQLRPRGAAPAAGRRRRAGPPPAPGRGSAVHGTIDERLAIPRPSQSFHSLLASRPQPRAALHSVRGRQPRSR